MFNNDPIIAVFDSGLGGISVLRALINKFKTGNFIYFADNLYMPYGEKSKTFILGRVKHIINILKNTYHADKIIIACNTASSVIKNDIIQHKENFKDVFIMEFDENYTYLATPQTKKNLSNISVMADRTLARHIEENITNNIELRKLISIHVKRHKLDQLNEFVLGCTHYELVSDYFKEFCPKTKVILNSEFVLDKLEQPYQKEKRQEINLHFIQTKESLEYNKKLTFLVYDSKRQL